MYGLHDTIKYTRILWCDIQMVNFETYKQYGLWHNKNGYSFYTFHVCLYLPKILKYGIRLKIKFKNFSVSEYNKIVFNRGK